MKNTLFLLALVFALCLPIITKADFSDVASDHPYAEAIKYSQENNIVNGYSDGTFKPENKINRAEFTKIIIEATQSKEDINGSNCFPDVKDEWFAKYVCTAKTKNIISGYPDGTFQPNKNISFVEAAKIINKAFKYKSEQADDIWYKNYVNDLSERYSIPQTIETLDKEITRSEFVEIIWRLKENKQNLPSMAYSEKYNNLKYKINGDYSKDKDNVYYSGKIIENADPNTFEIIDFSGVAKDKNNVYTSSGKIIENADPNTFEVLSVGYFKDKNKIYCLVRHPNLWYEGVIENADYKTFEVIHGYLAKDKKSVYYFGRNVAGLDPEFFNILSDAYFSDGLFVYLYDELPNLDIVSKKEGFELIGSRYGKDGDTAYYRSKKLENADIDTFMSINNSKLCAKDKNHIYCFGNVLNLADPETFNNIKDDYYGDKDKAWYCDYFRGCSIIKNADPETFEVFDNVYAKDKNQVYKLGKILEGADPATFDPSNP